MKRRTLLKLMAALGATACAPTTTTRLEPTPEPRVGRPERVAPTPTTTPRADDLRHGDWFRLKAEAARHWRMVPAVGDPSTVELLPINPPASDAPPKRVLVLYTRPSPAYDTAISRVLAVFRDKRLNAAVTVRNMTRDPALGQQALAFARSSRFDLVMPMGSDTTDFLVKSFQSDPTPVVTVCSKDPVLLGYLKDYDSGSRSNIAFTSLDAMIDLQLSYLQQVVPGLKNIAVLYSESNTSARETQVKPLKAILDGKGVAVLDVVVVDDKKARQELATKVAEAAAAMRRSDPGARRSIFWITGSTPVFNEIATINAGAGDIPVLSVVPDVVQEGRNSAALSIGVNFESNAYVAGVYAFEVLTGKSRPGELKVGVVSPPDISINFARTREVGLKIPFNVFESASFVYDHEGKLVRANGRALRQG